MPCRYLLEHNKRIICIILCKVRHGEVFIRSCRYFKLDLCQLPCCETKFCGRRKGRIRMYKFVGVPEQPAGVCGWNDMR